MALSHLLAGDGVAALSAIEDCVDTTLPPEIVKAHALQIIGNKGKAVAVLEGYAFQCIVGLFNACPALAVLKAEDTQASEKWISAVLATATAFEMEKANPLSTGDLFLSYAHIMAIGNENGKALAALQKAAELLAETSNYDEPFREAGPFDDLSELRAHMDVGNKAPRSERVIQDSLLAALTQNPAFESLRAQPEFQAIVDRFR